MELTVVPSPGLASPRAAVRAEELKNGAYRDLIQEMRETMVANNGIGLAANQVGRDLRLFVIDAKLAAEHKVSDVFANPEVTVSGRESDALEEGCLSIPGFWTPVCRARKVMFKALDGDGNRVKFRARGMLARVLQHETDHCNGRTIRDHSNASGKGSARR